MATYVYTIIHDKRGNLYGLCMTDVFLMTGYFPLFFQSTASALSYWKKVKEEVESMKDQPFYHDRAVLFPKGYDLYVVELDEKVAETLYTDGCRPLFAQNEVLFMPFAPISSTDGILLTLSGEKVEIA